ncbi:MAG: DNA recombination protein RmuC [Bdellovibrionota bacterium]
MEIILAMASGLLLGTIVGWFFGRGSGAREYLITKAALDSKVVALSERLNQRDIAADEKLELLSKTERQLQETFQALSAKSLKESTESLLNISKATFEGYQRASAVDLDARQKAINELVAPISEALKAIEANRNSTTSSLTEQIKAMNDSYVSLRNETGKLVQALKTPVARGKWGEVQLRRVVEFTGMIKHCDFEEQESKATDSGRLRPDMTVKLPNGRNIVVDAKVPLAAYLEAIETEDELQRGAKLKSHAVQIRAHIDNLSKKEYWAQFQPTPDFVFLFVPGESIYSAALQADPSLIEYAATNRVIIASPTSLITLLQVVAHGWREAHITENSNKIAQVGKDLYERISTFGEHYGSLRTAIENSVKHFNKTAGSLEGMILPSARKIKELGITTASSIEALEPIDSMPRLLTAAELTVNTKVLVVTGTDDKE